MSIEVAHPALPVAIIGAGPIGLAAAAHVVARGFTPIVFERGNSVAAHFESYRHVRLFSPWRYNLDKAAVALLETHGWQAPPPDELPTAGELVDRYLAPLAAAPGIADRLRLDHRVVAISREGFDRVKTLGRERAPFVLHVEGPSGAEVFRASAVLDASGTWSTPNPLGANGLPAIGEDALSGAIEYGMPDVLGTLRSRYAGKRVLVVGAGHSAINVALDLIALQKDAPDTKVVWALRRNRIEKLLGGGLNDQLPQRGALGLAAMEAIKGNRLEVLAPFAVQRIIRRGDALTVAAKLADQDRSLDVDRIVVATGLRPDLDMLRELRVAIDPSVEAPPALAPLIDPNLHSCGSVPPHGVVELAHPEPNFYIVGSKVYGRAPTFLMATGYEQVRSVIAELAGDHEAARRVELVLPETGVCSARPAAAAKAQACCGAAA
jgi:thioredoxin reductase